MNRYFLIALLSCMLTSCWTWQPKELILPPTASFTIVNNNCTLGCVVTFNSNAPTATSLKWEFGDGGTSTDANPTRQYTTAGNFTVRLTATNQAGSNSTTQTVTVNNPAAPVPNFTIANGDCVAPCEVVFTNTTTGGATGYAWNFGDGIGASTQQNPRYTFQTGGTYSVTLTATGPGGSRSTAQSVTIRAAPPVATFTLGNDNCNAPCTVNFTNTSRNATSFRWDFGNGITSTEQNPSIQFSTAGNYTVQLTASGSNGTNTTTQTVRTVVPRWRSVATFPGVPRSDVGIFVLNNRAYVIGGVLGADRFSNEVWEYDGNGNQWNQKRSISASGAYGVGFTNNNTGYIIGHTTDLGNGSNLVHTYNPGSDSWTNRIESSLQNRPFCQACAVNGKAYLGVGFNQTTLVEYDLNTTSATTIPVPAALNSVGGGIRFPINGRCFIGGGFTIINNQVSIKTQAFEFDPGTRQFLQRGDVPENTLASPVGPRSFFLNVENGQLYLYQNGQFSTVETGNKPSFNRGGIFLFSIGNTLYYGGGYNFSNSSLPRFTDIWAINLN